jgi:enoyl-CoA hydratase/carnithine racemase
MPSESRLILLYNNVSLGYEQIQGKCESSGVQLVAASDLAIATPTSTFSLAFAKFGLLDHSPAVAMLRSNVPR